MDPHGNSVAQVVSNKELSRMAETETELRGELTEMADQVESLEKDVANLSAYLNQATRERSRAYDIAGQRYEALLMANRRNSELTEQVQRLHAENAALQNGLTIEKSNRNLHRGDAERLAALLAQEQAVTTVLKRLLGQFEGQRISADIEAELKLVKAQLDTQRKQNGRQQRLIQRLGSLLHDPFRDAVYTVHDRREDKGDVTTEGFVTEVVQETLDQTFGR